MTNYKTHFSISGTRHRTFRRLSVVIAIILLTFPAAMTATSPDSLRIRVYDAATNGPVEFCNIIAKNVATGALADEWGRATLRVGPRTLRDTLMVSCVGYDKVMVVMRPEIAETDTLRIYMKPKEYNLSEVTIRPAKKTKVLRKGKRHSGGIAMMTESIHRGDCYAWEAGTKGKRTWLTGIEIQSYRAPQPPQKKKSDSIVGGKEVKIYPPVEKTRIRVNIYDASGKSTKSSGVERWNYTNVLHSPLIIHFSDSLVVDNCFTYSFPEPVLLPEKALVELEILDEIPEDELFFFKSNIFGRGVIFRDVNDHGWLKFPVATPFTLTFLEEKL